MNKQWTHLKLKNGDQVQFIPPSPNGEQLGGITEEERNAIQQFSNLASNEDINKLFTKEVRDNG